jgi:hypothetical protein
MKLRKESALGLVLQAAALPPRLAPELPKPEINIDLLVVPGINPNRQRKGKSGETARARGRKG